MAFQLIGGGSDLSTTQTQVNKTILELKNNEVTTVFKDDSGEYGVLIGKKPNGKRGIMVYTNGIPVIDIGQLEDDTNGMKVSPTGTDVTTATDDELIFNSNQNILKVASRGQVTLTPDNTGSPNYTVAINPYTVSVDLTSLNLTSTPAVTAYFKFPIVVNNVYTTDSQALPYSALGGASSNLSNLFYSVTSTTLTFYYNQYTSVNFGVPPNIVFTYYVFQESAE